MWIGSTSSPGDSSPMGRGQPAQQRPHGSGHALLETRSPAASETSGRHHAAGVHERIADNGGPRQNLQRRMRWSAVFDSAWSDGL
jgi:hypothetical protein